MNTQIKALVVDDSAFMRKSISIMLEGDGDIKVIATARDGEEGLNLCKTLRPDIVTLDIEMPKMDGLTALKRIMAECPTPVIMISSLTNEGADATIKALEYGAVDFIPKELSFVNVNIIKIKDDLIKKIKEIHKQNNLKSRFARLQNFRIKNDTPSRESSYSNYKYSDNNLPRLMYNAVAIGISTGGPLSLQSFLPKVKKDIRTPIFLVQHMPPKFTASLAQRLNSICALEVREAENNDVVKAGVVYIAPGGFHMKIKKGAAGQPFIDITTAPADTLHRPSVDVMMDSVIDYYGKNTLSVIMTGMGKDGYEATKRLKLIGGGSIAQDEDSCVVFGMPKAIVDGGLADVIAPLEKISDVINKAI